MSLAVLFAVHCPAAEPRRAGSAIPYVVYNGYFVSNQFEPNAPSSFVLLQNQTEFDRVFGVASVMFDRSRRLEPDAFRNNIVITVIHRGHANIRYRVVSQTRDGSILHLTYNTSGHRTPSTEYACPLIVSTARDNYSAVAFIENGKLVKTVPVNAPNR